MLTGNKCYDGMSSFNNDGGASLLAWLIFLSLNRHINVDWCWSDVWGVHVAADRWTAAGEGLMTCGLMLICWAACQTLMMMRMMMSSGFSEFLPRPQVQSRFITWCRDVKKQKNISRFHRQPRVSSVALQADSWLSCCSPLAGARGGFPVRGKAMTLTLCFMWGGSLPCLNQWARKGV